MNNLDHPPIPPDQLNSWEKAPSYLVDYDEQPSLRDDILNNMSRKAGSSRTAERDQKISELRLKYPKHWGKRGGARFIALHETPPEDPISARTVQNYFKITKT